MSDLKCSCTHEAGDSDCAAHPSCCGCGMDISHQRIVRDRDTLRLRLAAVERERDEAVEVIATWSADLAHDTVRRVEAERDAAIQRAAMFERMYDDALKRYQPAEARCAQVEAETAEAIADYLQDVGATVASEEIRAGAWRGKEGV